MNEKKIIIIKMYFNILYQYTYKLLRIIITISYYFISLITVLLLI